MSRYEPRMSDHGPLQTWIVFDTERNVAVTTGSTRRTAIIDCARFNQNSLQSSEWKLVRNADSYRVALMLIARNSQDPYAQDVANKALSGGSNV